MASTTLLQHHLHEQHPLEPRDFSKDSLPPLCHLCYWKISTDGYACEECFFYLHRVCANAPPQIDAHPLHPDHPLALILRPPPNVNNICDLCEISHDSLFRCDECDFNLDIRCALSTLSDLGGTQGKTPKQIMLPLHRHPLTSFSTRHDFIGESNCVICKASVKGDGDGNGYACLHYRCEFIIHKRCVQDLFGDEHDLNVDISSTSSTLLDRGGSAEKTPRWITHPLHDHLLSLFSMRYDFVKASDCVICKESVKGDGDGYACLHWRCEFLIHKSCIRDLYYKDGTKAPQIYHDHPLETFLAGIVEIKFMGFQYKFWRRCTKCRSKASLGEFIGCASCQVFYCRDCVQVPENIHYPPHHQKHILVLLIKSIDTDQPQCESCSYNLKLELCYGCTSCGFFVDVGCALQVLAYCKEGMRAEIKLSWHKHPLLLCHRTNYDLHHCSYCEEKSAGPMYACKEKGCEILLHKQCTEIETTIICPHHPDHPLTLRQVTGFQHCRACWDPIIFLGFSCKLCAFYLHYKCAARLPARKHSLHEHELLHLDKAPFFECNRCGTSTNASFFRCVPCNFNLHEACMELPQVVKSKIHWHPLTLHETFLEDDTGEYYCEHCEKRRDGRLGVYVCGQCKLEIPRIYHIKCVLPEIQAFAIKRMAERIAIKRGEVSAAQEKLEKVKRELDELMKRNKELIYEGGVSEESD